MGPQTWLNIPIIKPRKFRLWNSRCSVRTKGRIHMTESIAVFRNRSFEAPNKTYQWNKYKVTDSAIIMQRLHKQLTVRRLEAAFFFFITLKRQVSKVITVRTGVHDTTTTNKGNLFFAYHYEFPDFVGIACLLSCETALYRILNSQFFPDTSQKIYFNILLDPTILQQRSAMSSAFRC